MKLKKIGKALGLSYNWKRRMLGLRSPSLKQHRFTVLLIKTQTSLVFKGTSPFASNDTSKRNYFSLHSHILWGRMLLYF